MGSHVRGMRTKGGLPNHKTAPLSIPVLTRVGERPALYFTLAEGLVFNREPRNREFSSPGRIRRRAPTDTVAKRLIGMTRRALPARPSGLCNTQTALHSVPHQGRVPTKPLRRRDPRR